MSNKKVMSIIEILLAGTVFLVMAVVIGYEPLEDNTILWFIQNKDIL